MSKIKRMPVRFKHALLVAAVAMLGACQSVQTTQGGVVGVNRTQRMAVSSAEIDQASAQQYAQQMAEESAKGTLNRNPAQYARVRAISARLIRETIAFRPDAAQWAWEANVISSPEVNAWCMPGGKIAVYSGLIDKLQVTDDELAAVIGHEIAHALREHARERISRQMGTGILASIADIVGAQYGVQGVGQIASAGLDVSMNLPHSRDQETEADRIGVELAARAGYNPHAAVTLWQKMGSTGGNAPVRWLSTHPSQEDRLRDLTHYSQVVMPLYEQARGRR